MITFVFIGIILGLWIYGGQKKGRIRDIGAPIALGVGIIPTLHGGDYFKMIIVAVLTIALANSIRCGYGNFSPEDDDRPSFLASITHDRQGAIIRLIWGMLVGAITPLALLFTGYLAFPSYIAYIVTNAAVNFSVSKFRFPVMLADICVAGAFGSLLLYLK